jgi:hypothetical protein
VSQVAEEALRNGLEAGPGGQRSALGAMCALIRHVALVCAGDNYSKSPWASSEWRTDPWRFRVFEIVIAKLLEALRPEGEMRPSLPEDAIDELEAEATAKSGGELPELERRSFTLLRHRAKSPENDADGVVDSIWTKLNPALGTLQLTEKDIRSSMGVAAKFEENEGFAMQILRDLSDLQKIRVDLDPNVILLRDVKTTLEDPKLCAAMLDPMSEDKRLKLLAKANRNLYDAILGRNHSASILKLKPQPRRGK